MSRHDERPADTVADLSIWALFFLGIGTLILANLPPTNAGRFIIIAAIAYTAAAGFLFRLLIRKDHR